MFAHSCNLGIWVSLVLTGIAHAHIAAFHPAMYCVNGTDPSANPNNNNAPVQPLYDLPYSKFWMHHSNGCDELPPSPGVFLELDAGGNFTVELAGNRAFTSLNPDAHLTEYIDGDESDTDYLRSPEQCVYQPNLHTQNESMAAGTAWAISHESDISKVTPEKLTVFSVLYHTPWRRLATYQVPPGLPECPEGGCICVWLWIPDGCGQPNMYMFPYRCKVNPDSSPKTIGEPQPPIWCEDDPSTCVTGPKQMLIWHQADSNNINVEGYDLSGQPKSPAYNMKCGFPNGAQHDIFVDATSSTPVVISNTNSIASGTPTGSTPAGFSTPYPSLSSGVPAGTGAPSGSPADPSIPAPSGKPSFSPPSFPSGSNAPSVLPSSSQTGSGTPSFPPSSFHINAGTPSIRPSSLPTGSGTPTFLPSSFPSPASGSGWPSPSLSGDPGASNDSNWSSHTPTALCTFPSESSTAVARRGTHSKRMMREKRGVF